MHIKNVLKVIGLGLYIFASPLSGASTQDITVLLDWFINPDHAPLIVAEQEGLFEKAGLKVTLVEPADPSLPPKLAAAKQADLAISYQPSLMVDLNNSLPLMRVGTIVNSPLNSLVVLADSEIKSVKDLKGKTVGFSVGGFEDAVLGAMLETHGLVLDDVRLVNVNFALSPSLYAGQVDAVIGAFRNFGRAFYPEDHGVPTYEELIFVAHPEYAKTVKVRRFLDVIDQATQLILQSPDTMYRSFVSYRPEDLDNELNRRAWRDTIPRLAPETRQTDAAQWERFAQFMEDRGLIQNPPKTETYLFVSGAR